jgi:exonuclease III
MLAALMLSPGTFGSVDSFMRRLRCDVLCLQETKASHSLLQQQPHAAAANIGGWDSYWACNMTERGGFNGVCTYARHGVTQEAYARPFDDRSLDDEGRALVTVHGGLAIVNVYVPCGGGDGKVRFLKATREVCHGLRKRGLRVVLLGDLNASRRACDVSFKWRYVSLAPPCQLFPPSVTSALPRLLYAAFTV